MRTQNETQPRRELFHIPWLLGFCVFAAIALFFLWNEHKAHILGVAPYVLLLLCPIIHLLMHRGQHGHRDRFGDEGPGQQPRDEGSVS